MSLATQITLGFQRVAAEIKKLRGTPVPLTYAATITVDCSLGNVFDVTLAGAATFNFTNGTNGQKITLRVRQDGTGGRTWTPGTMVRFGTDVPLFALSTAAGKLDRIGLEVCSADSKYDVLSYAKGF